MKKLVAVLMAALMLVGMASVASAEWKFERKIDIICPWGVGGGADSTLRPMTNLLKDILGQQVDVVNVEGGGGVNGVEYTYKQPADGYTFMLPPHILTYECGLTAGQFPKFEEDVYRLTEDPAFPTYCPADGGVLADECAALVRQFFQNRRVSHEK